MLKRNTHLDKCIEKANQSIMLFHHGGGIFVDGHCIGQGKK